jgi:hypothetical protein
VRFLQQPCKSTRLTRIYQSEPTGPAQISALKAIRLVDFASKGPTIDGD